jgi:hypothetical protein
MLIQVSIADAMNDHRLTVVPVICIGNRSVNRGGRSGGVAVVDANSIAKYIGDRPAVLTKEDVQALAVKLDYALPPYERRT